MNELKSVLVQMDSSPRSQIRLELANQLALAQDAQVTALYPQGPSYRLPIKRGPLAGELVPAMQAMQEAHVATARAQFDQLPADKRHWVMHSQLELPGAVIMGADGPPRQDPPRAGAHINVMVDTPAEAEKIFAALLEGGTASMPIQETFWAHRFGMLVDRFGTPGMVNCLKPM